MKRYLASFGFAVAAALLAAASSIFMPAHEVYAQPSGAVQSIAPLTRNLATLKTLTAQTATQTISADQDGYNVSRVVCSYNQTAAVGNPAVTFTIQNKHPGAAAYYTLVTSASITSATNFPVAISAGNGVATTANVGAGIPIAKGWRVIAAVSGTTSVTGTIACSVQ